MEERAKETTMILGMHGECWRPPSTLGPSLEEKVDAADLNATIIRLDGQRRLWQVPRRRSHGRTDTR